MTKTLAQKTCTPCRGGVPPLARDEALRFQAQAPDWERAVTTAASSARFDSAISGKRLPSCSKSASSPRAKAITPISVSAGVARRFSKHQEDEGIARE
jgi:hypothetical protein